MGPLEVWVGEVSDRTWWLSWRPAVSSQTGGVVYMGRWGGGSGTSMEPVFLLRTMGDLRWMLIGSETGSAWSGWSWDRSSRLP